MAADAPRSLFRQVGIVILLIFAGLLVACAKNPSGAQSGSSAAVAAAKLSGTWEGLIPQGIDFTYIRIELRSPPGDLGATASTDLQGVAYLQSFRDYLEGHDVKTDVQAASVPITLRFNSQLNTFTLSPAVSRGRAVNLLGGRNLGGVYDAMSGVLTGLTGLVNQVSQYFLIMRPDRFEDLAEQFEDLSQVRPGSNRTPFLLSLLSGPGETEIRNWAQKLYDEYPDTDLYRVAHGPLEQMAIKLFRDEHFGRYFDQPFDELSWRSLKGFQRVLIQDFSKSRDRRDRSTGALERMFWVGPGDNSAKQTTFWVIAQRYYLNWRGQQLDRLERLALAKSSYQYIDDLSAEMAKMGQSLLWPSELQADQQRIQAAQARIALPSLNLMLGEFQSEPPSVDLMNRLAGWRQQEQRIFGYLAPGQSDPLLKAADVRLEQVIDSLLPDDIQAIAGLGQGIEAVERGVEWYKGMNRKYASVIQRASVQKVLQQFSRVRAEQLAAAQSAMLARIRAGYAALPAGMAPATDGDRIRFCQELKGLEARWFGVTGDSQVPGVEAVLATMRELGGLASARLPPRLAGQTGYPPVHATPLNAGEAGFAATQVDRSILRLGSLAANDALVKSYLPAPIASPGVILESNVVWALFHGRFDELDSRYADQQGLASRIVGNLNIHPQVHYAFVTYVGLSSQQFGERQIGPAVNISWTTTQTDEQGSTHVVREGWGKVNIAESLQPFYERSYKIARKVSTSDAVFGRNGLEIFTTMLKMGQGDWFSSARMQPDGELQMFAATWEKPVLSDLTQLLRHWSARSWALWQFQENLQRYLETRPSIQSLYGWK